MTDFGASAIEKHNKSIVYRTTEKAFFIVMGMYFFFLYVTRTTIDPLVPERRDLYMISILALATVIRLALLVYEDRSNRSAWIKYIAMALAVDAVYFCMYRVNPQKLLVFIAVITLGTIGLDYMKVLRIHAVIASVVLSSGIVMAMMGAITNYVYVRDMAIRSSWGTKYPTNFMSLLFFLLLVFWVILKEKGDLWFLLPGAAHLLASYYIAQSRTGMMCSILFMIAVCVDHFLSHSEREKLRKVINMLLCAAFPIFSVLLIGLVFAYKACLPGSYRINDIMSDRLALSLTNMQEHGIHLFGSQIEQIGNGGSSFARPEYNFLDITYVMLLLEYGVVALLMVNILWVAMTRKAIRIGDSRLAFALALIAANATSEHHILQLSYNVFMAMPFAIIAADITAREPAKTPTPAEDKKDTLQRLAALAAVLAAAYAVLIIFLPVSRTIVSLTNINDSEKGRLVLFAVVAAGLVMGFFALRSLYRVLLTLMKRDRAFRVIDAAVILAAVIAAAGLLVIGDRISAKGAIKYADTLKEEQAVLELVQDSKSGGFYVSDIPTVYKKEYGDIDTSIFNGEELGRYRDASVVMDKDTDTPCLFDTGFLYTQISDEHALFTNDEPVIRALEDAGYHLTGYFPLEKSVDMADLARRNGVDLNEDGSITLDGETLHKGPRADLRAGRYTVTYDLSVDPVPAAGDDSEVCKLITRYYKGEFDLNETVITGDKFDRNGDYTASVIFETDDAENTDFCVYPTGDNVITVRSISYQKTPKYDIHSIYNKDRVKTREEYYDPDGTPYDQVAGYFARDLEYDGYGNISHEIYYDSSNNRTLIPAGYCEVRRTFDDLHHVLREEYYGTEGERIALSTKQSAVEYEYDGTGHQTEVRFYGVNDEPVEAGGETWGGYYRILREFDSAGRTIREEFFDNENKPVMLKEGFSSRTFEYDEYGNKIREAFFDIENKPVLRSEGYAEVRREYDNNSRVVKETYYGTDGGRIVLPPGHSAVEYRYDESGNQKEVLFYGVNDEPVSVGNAAGKGYHKVVKEYDEQGREIRDSFLDEHNNYAVADEGYSVRTYEYDINGNKIREAYYDADGKPVMCSSGYSEIRMEYSASGEFIRERYLDTAGKDVPR